MNIKHFPPTTPNLGDSALNLGTQNIIEKIIPKKSEFLTLTSHPFYWLLNYSKDSGMFGQGICAESLTLDQKNPDFIVIGGGPLWGSPGLLRVDPNIKKFSPRTPVIVIGIGCFDYESLSMDDFDNIRDRLVLFSARDEQTLRVFQRDFPKIPAFMTGCPALHLKGDPIIRKNSNYFIVSYRSQKLSEGLMCTPEVVRSLSNLIQAEPLIIFHDYRDFFADSHIFADAKIPYTFANSVESALILYEYAKFTITYRLHGAILSATCGTPFFHIAIDWRGYYFGKTFDPDQIYHVNLLKESPKLSNLYQKILDALSSDYSAINLEIKKSEKSMACFIKKAKAAL